jgi:hypothetical protein
MDVTYQVQPSSVNSLYCRFCGKPIIDSITSDTGETVDPRQEKENRAHTKCLRAYAARNPAPVEPVIAPEPISDELVAQYAKELKNKQ